MTNNIYANARAVTAMRNLLGYDRLVRMAESANAKDAFKILSEVNFGDGTTSDASEYEALLAAEEQKLTSFIREVSPNEKLTRFLLAPKDYHNAQALMKAKFLKTDAAPMLTEEGLYKTELLKEKIFADDYDEFPSPMAEALAKADVLFVSGEADGRKIDVLFKKALYRQLRELSDSDRLLGEIYRVKADAANIATALRSRDFQEAKLQFVGGGRLGEDELKILCGESVETIAEKFRYSPLKDLVFAATEGFSEGKPLSGFERLADGYALAQLKKERYNDEGYRPFLLYCYYKTAELTNVRIVMSCLSNQIFGSDIKSRLRETYEG